MEGVHFPLYEEAARRGILDGTSALVVAPTATGKSFIGRTVVRRAVERGAAGIHAYLVPYRSLAAEIYDGFLDELAATRSRVRLLTGDHRDPIRPDQADLVVATYESFTTLLQRPEIQPGVVVADEIHLVTDPSRGPEVEGLFARLLSERRFEALCGLSAVVENGEALAEWLGVELLHGSAADRPVPLELHCEVTDDVDEALARLLDPCADGEQALVFCSSRSAAERTAKWLSRFVGPTLADEDRPALRNLAGRVLEEDPDADGLSEALLGGVAFHHAGMLKPLRRIIEDGFRERHVRAIASTPTLAAGVNLPAQIAVVRDVFRGEMIRGEYRPVLLPSGEILNMLGRAARPGRVSRGVGVALVPSKASSRDDVERMMKAVSNGHGAEVHSRLPDRFDSVMRFVLALAIDAGELGQEQVAEAYRRTLAYREGTTEVAFDRPFEEDLMEDIPSWKKVVEAKGAIHLGSYGVTGAGVEATVISEKKGRKASRYAVTLGVTGLQCSCPAARKYFRKSVCKHEACAIHDLLFGAGVDEEVRTRAIFACAHVFGRTLDPGTRLSLALEVLTVWGLLERVPGGWRVTPVGKVAATPGFDLLLVRQAVTRIGAAQSPGYREVAMWTVDDYLADSAKRERWRKAVGQWLDEVDRKDLRLPTKWRGDFERGLEDLAAVCRLYGQAAVALGRDELAATADEAGRAMRYGVDPRLVPIAGLGLPKLGRARARLLFDAGIRGLDDLAAADPATLSSRRMPRRLVESWVERALEIQQARANADGLEADAEFDELVSRFRIDPEALA